MAGKHARTRGRVVITAAVASAAAAVLGISPALAAIPPTYYVRGTNIGGVPPESVHRAWVDGTVGATVGPHAAPIKVNYPGGFWPVSKGYLGDPTYGQSVDQGVRNLTAALVAAGDDDNPVIIHGYSQGAVVATHYMRIHPGEGNIYVLTANPNRPNGGVLARFPGLYIPILDVSFDGATPTDDDVVIDIARQYDGWADFPKYPLNLLATANALLGIVYLHGKYPETVTPEVLADLEPTVHGNTTYYLVPTARLPLLMPLEGLVPASVLDALDRPLRAVIETGYDRTDYGEPTPAAVIPSLSATTITEPSRADRTETLAPELEEQTQKRQAPKRLSTLSRHSTVSDTPTEADDEQVESTPPRDAIEDDSADPDAEVDDSRAEDAHGTAEQTDRDTPEPASETDSSNAA